jgi:hypothetical protein
LKNNGITDDFEKEILTLLSISQLKSVDLSCNKMEKLGNAIGKKLRDEVTNFTWLDFTQNEFLYDTFANTAIIAGFKR